MCTAFHILVDFIDGPGVAPLTIYEFCFIQKLIGSDSSSKDHGFSISGNGGEIFVPKLPSMKLTEIVETLAPQAEVKMSGIRPGEKLHEVLLTEDEARTTYDYGEHFVVYPPTFQSQDPAKIRSGGTLVPKDFCFSSENNTNWLSVEDLRRLIDAVQDHGDKLPPFTPGGGN